MTRPKLRAVTPLADPATQPQTRPKKVLQDKPTSILDQRFRYTSSAATDLKAKFRAMGFKPTKPKRVK
jgi:hypothetical protein